MIYELNASDRREKEGKVDKCERHTFIYLLYFTKPKVAGTIRMLRCAHLAQ